MIATPAELESSLKSASERLGVQCHFDTHFEAQNWELSWWKAGLLHRLDFQPGSMGGVSVTHYQDKFPILPRLLHWARSSVPYFPYLARTERMSSSSIALPIEEREVLDLVAGAVSASSGSK